MPVSLKAVGGGDGGEGRLEEGCRGRREEGSIRSLGVSGFAFRIFLLFSLPFNSAWYFHLVTRATLKSMSLIHEGSLCTSKFLGSCLWDFLSTSACLLDFSFPTYCYLHANSRQTIFALYKFNLNDPFIPIIHSGI